ncbi:MAG: DegV family EDD domain-containing protein, partial [Clostridia bacterium]|nr:DegV family EDD domain-containing protein [Clostridia bacterium]
MKIAITAESTIDSGKDLLKEKDIHTVPFHVYIGGVEYEDGAIDCDEIFSSVNSSGELPKTSSVNRFQFEEFFGDILKTYDAIIHISLSSKLSGAYGNAVAAAKEFKNVFVIDSETLSSGIALLALYATDLVAAGNSAEDIYEKVQKRRAAVQASFALNRLDYLYKGGRCSAMKFYGANLLKLRPRIVVGGGEM